MSGDKPPVDLTRADRVGGFRVEKILGWGAEGVAADVTDELLGLKRVLKAYPATPFWIRRMRYVSEVFDELSKLSVCPAPITGGVAATSRSVPIVYLVVQRQIGRPLESMLSQRWSEARAVQMMSKLTDAVATVHSVGWALGDFEAGNNVVVIDGRPLFIDIGLDREAFERPSYEEDFECLADIARRLAQRSRSSALLDAANSLCDRSDRRLDRRSLSVWRSTSSL